MDKTDEPSRRPAAKAVELPLEWDGARMEGLVEELEHATRVAHAWRCADELATAWDKHPKVRAVRPALLAPADPDSLARIARGNLAKTRERVELEWAEPPSAQERKEAAEEFGRWRDSATGIVEDLVARAGWIWRPAEMSGAGLRRAAFERFISPKTRMRWESDLLAAELASAPGAQDDLAKARRPGL